MRCTMRCSTMRCTMRCTHVTLKRAMTNAVRQPVLRPTRGRGMRQVGATPMGRTLKSNGSVLHNEYHPPTLLSARMSRYLPTATTRTLHPLLRPPLSYLPSPRILADGSVLDQHQAEHAAPSIRHQLTAPHPHALLQLSAHAPKVSLETRRETATAR